MREGLDCGLLSSRHRRTPTRPLGPPARRTLGIAWRYYDELEALGCRLVRERIGDADFERFLARLVPLPVPKPDATVGGRAVRNVERVREAIRRWVRRGICDDVRLVGAVRAM